MITTILTYINTKMATIADVRRPSELVLLKTEQMEAATRHIQDSVRTAPSESVVKRFITNFPDAISSHVELHPKVPG